MGLTDLKSSSPVNWVIMTFRMPLFFFISGFFAYRSCTRWTYTLLSDILKRKIKAQIICTLIFYCLYQFCFNLNILSWLSTGPGKFWFTIALFQMFLIFLFLSLLSKIFSTERILDVGLLLVSSIWGISVIAPSISDFWNSSLGVILCQYKVSYYFQFFAFGIFCRKYLINFELLLTKDLFKTFFIILFVLCLCFLYCDQYKFPAMVLKLINNVIVRYAGLIILIGFFFHYRQFFINGRLVLFLKYIGRRTLDIYMLHYFFLPDLTLLTSYFIKGNSVIIHFFGGIIISLLIILLCLLISNILRSSRFLASWLFGVRDDFVQRVPQNSRDIS